MSIRFSTTSDIEQCRRIHKKFGTTYYYSTLRFPKRIQWRVHAIYAFVRVPDEWVDNPGEMGTEQRLELLRDWRSQLTKGINGERPEHFAMRAFCDAVTECRIPVEEAFLFLDAMEMDITRTRYETYEDLRGYMRGSASAIGVMMCYAMCARTDFDTIARAKALGEAMQLTNFLRDINEDMERGRIYLPLEDMARFSVSEADLRSKVVTSQFRELLKFEIARARSLYLESDFGIYKLPPKMRKAVLLSRLLYSQILDRIEAQEYDVFRQRARTNSIHKARCAMRVLVNDKRILTKLVSDSGVRI
jgi:15-cis-phytoene synthase